MKKDIYLFYPTDYDALTFFKIKNADLRNPDVIVEHRFYRGDVNWKTFVASFIAANSKNISDNKITINRDYVGFILMYYDTILEKDIIVIDPNKIIEKISE